MDAQGKRSVESASTQSRSARVLDLVHLLSEVPGSASFEVVARSFPRRDPGLGTFEGYKETVQSFDASQTPPELPLEPNAEQVSINLRGKLDAKLGRRELVSMVNDLLLTSGMAMHWGFRTEISGNSANDERRFTLQVFEEDLERMDYA